MKTLKKTTAILLSLIIAFSASIIGFADKAKSNIPIVIKTDSYGNSYVCAFFDGDSLSFEKIEISERDENGENSVLLSLHSENFSEYCNVKDHNGFISVRIKEKNFFEPEGNYTVTFYPLATPPEGHGKEELVSVDFNYGDCIEPEFECTYIYETIEAGDEMNISEFVALPENYMGETYYYYWYNYLSDDDREKIISVRSTTAYALKEGYADIVIKDELTGKQLCVISLHVLPRKADSFSELMKLTFGEIGETFTKTFDNVSNMMNGALFLAATPFMLIINLFASMFDS